MNQGAFANYTGNKLQMFIFHTLKDKGYMPVDKRQFRAGCYLEQPIFTPQFPLCKGIYGTDIKCDFILYHPQKHPKCLVIESKWQQGSGSVDEKFPYLVENIKKMYPHVTIIVLDGGGYKKQADTWLRNQVDSKLINVFNMAEFQKWANTGGL